VLELATVNIANYYWMLAGGRLQEGKSLIKSGD
jgi:hypothetical protein